MVGSMTIYHARFDPKTRSDDEIDMALAILWERRASVREENQIALMAVIDCLEWVRGADDHEDNINLMPGLLYNPIENGRIRGW